MSLKFLQESLLSKKAVVVSTPSSIPLLCDIYFMYPIGRVIHSFCHEKHRKGISIVSICLTPKWHIKIVFIFYEGRELCVSRDYKRIIGTTEFNIVARITFD